MQGYQFLTFPIEFCEFIARICTVMYPEKEAFDKTRPKEMQMLCADALSCKIFVCLKEYLTLPCGRDLRVEGEGPLYKAKAFRINKKRIK